MAFEVEALFIVQIMNLMCGLATFEALGGILDGPGGDDAGSKDDERLARLVRELRRVAHESLFRPKPPKQQ
mgnify:CR=1 FL=1